MAHTFELKYTAWISDYVAAQPDRYVRGKCKEATEAMVKAFPELRQAAGFVYTSWGRDQHFWCVYPDGSIVDPTESQFPFVFEYQEIDLNDPEARSKIPTGVCMDCGADAYEGRTFCSSECEAATLAYMRSI